MPDENIPYHRRRILSFKYAIQGIWSAFKEEPNLKSHFLCGYLVVLAGIFFGLTKSEWIDVVMLIGLVISVELTNTAIEAVVDSFTIKEHPGAKLAKDISAGATLAVAIVAAIVGVLIFWPYVLRFWL